MQGPVTLRCIETKACFAQRGHWIHGVVLSQIERKKVGLRVRENVFD